jgi:Tfp pilus assembly protein PilF
MCNQKLENFVNAAKLFKKSIKIDPQFAPAHFELALTYDTLGKTREVKKELNIVRMLDQELHSVLVEELEKN